MTMLLAGVVSMRHFDWMEMFTRSSRWFIESVLAASVPLALYSWWRRRAAIRRRKAAERVELSKPALDTLKRD